MSCRPVLRACAATALAFVFGAAAALPAAAEGSSVAEPAVLASMQRDLGLTAAQAERRVRTEQAAAVTEQALAAELGDRYGGSWLADDGTLVVATTDPAAAGRITAAGAVPQMRPAQQDPDEAMKRLDAAASARGSSDGSQVPDGVGAWWVDEAAGLVVVEATDVAAGAEFKAAAGDHADLVRVQEVTEAPLPYVDLVGGDAILAAAGGRCSVGFSATSGSGTFVITAGHCTEAGGDWLGFNRVPIGPTETSSFPGDDYGTIRVADTGTWTPTSRVAGTSSVLGSTVAAIGASTCRSGSTTGFRCGVIQSRDASVNYGAGDIVLGLTRTDACAEPGDSGGSFVAGRQAQGMTSGGNGNCAVGGITYFQPLDEVLVNLGLTLVTG